VSVPRTTLATARLVLRPSEAGDAARAFEIQSNPQVTLTLRIPSFPPARADLDAWFAGHEREWREGSAYRFAMLLDGAMVGMVDLNEVAGGRAGLGYWLDQPYWGRGLTTEAAREVVRFGFETLGLREIFSGHFLDNPASGRVLLALGFRPDEESEVFSTPRGQMLPHRRYLLP
jgi:RimJ/RimL family protein N-acetyltransferase